MAGLTPEVGVFLTRLTRLDGTALVRIRRAPDGATLWARVPWDVLVTRTVGGVDLPLNLGDDITVSARAWLAAGDADPSDLARQDSAWRVGLPNSAGVVVETMPTRVVRRVSTAAAETWRETARSGLEGRAVGERTIRDALLDHVPITITMDGPRETSVGKLIEVPQRIVQAVARMSFLGGDEEPVDVVVAGPWVGISTAHGSAWWRRPVGLSVRPHTA